MQAVTDAWAAAVTAGHQTVAYELDIYESGVLIAQGIPFTGGSLDVSTGGVRRHGRIEYEGLVSQVSPYGTEVTIKAGFVYTDGTTELLSVITGGIEEPEEADEGAGVRASFEVYDRSKSISDRKLSQPYYIASGTNVATAIRTLLLSRRSDLTFQFATTVRTTPTIVYPENTDPWDAAVALAQSIGMELFFNGAGVCVLRLVPSVDPADIAAVYTVGQSGCTLTRVARRRSTRDTFSHIVVTGETTATAAPVRADAYDTDPQSPTYYRGPFGDRPYFHQSSLITSSAQASEAAQGLLDQKSGFSEGVELALIPNVALDALDSVHVADSRLGINSLYTLDSYRVDFGPAGLMTAQTRTRRAT